MGHASLSQKLAPQVLVWSGILWLHCVIKIWKDVWEVAACMMPGIWGASCGQPHFAVASTAKIYTPLICLTKQMFTGISDFPAFFVPFWEIPNQRFYILQGNEEMTLRSNFWGNNDVVTSALSKVHTLRMRWRSIKLSCETENSLISVLYRLHLGLMLDCVSISVSWVVSIRSFHYAHSSLGCRRTNCM